MLKKYATDEIIAETESEITHFAQPSKIAPSQYAEELVTKTLCRRDVHEK